HIICLIRALIISFFLFLLPSHPISTLFPYTTLFRSLQWLWPRCCLGRSRTSKRPAGSWGKSGGPTVSRPTATCWKRSCAITTSRDRKSTRLNSSHLGISYAVFCLKKKNIHCHAFPLH